jgi:tetratricopeptide (TPR) repeat protein
MSAIQSAIDDQTYELVASQDAIRQTLGQGFDSVNNTLTWGFTGLANELGAMSSNMNMGFAVTEAAIGRMSKDVCDRLDAIGDMLNNPHRTAARELYRRALTNYRKGFYEEALPDITEAIEKDKTDYLSWLLEGQIHTFGAGETGSVIDLDKAIDAYTTAARYNKPDIAASEDAKRFASEIYFLFRPCPVREVQRTAPRGKQRRIGETARRSAGVL